MADKLTVERRSENMRAIRSKDTKPEMLVRRLIHAMGFRYRLHRKALPGKPDLVFPARRKIIFIHGCFWHQHPKPGCKYAHKPRSNSAYWKPKLSRNAERDRENRRKLEKEGWEVLVLWECEIEKDQSLPKRIQLFLEA